MYPYSLSDKKPIKIFSLLIQVGSLCLIRHLCVSFLILCSLRSYLLKKRFAGSGPCCLTCKNAHGWYVFFSLSLPLLLRPRFITFFSSFDSVFNNQSYDYSWRFCCKRTYRVCARDDYFVAVSVMLKAACCLCAFFSYISYEILFYFVLFSFFYGYALFILLVVV